MKHRGNHLPPVFISHPSAALDENPDGLGGSHVQPADRQRKRPDVTPVAQKASAISQGFGSSAAPLGDWQLTNIRLMFCLSGFLLSTDF